MLKNLLCLIALMFAVNIANAQDSDELKQRTQKYGFEVKNLDNLICNPEPVFSRSWYGICVSNSRERNHSAVAWRLPTTKKVEVQMNFGGDMLAAKGETVSWRMVCKADDSFQDPTGMNGLIADCDWTSRDQSKAKVYATFFYFVPRPGSGIENVLIFSDFGKGENPDEVKNRARTFLQKGNLLKLQD